MIHTNELMLGNWVEFEGLPNKVTWIGSNHVWLNGETVNHHYTGIDGIPITEELLEKCGFTKIEGERSYRIDDVVIIYGVPSTKCWMIKMFAFGKIPVFDIHELQNAYFMLTKKHLEVKL